MGGDDHTGGANPGKGGNSFTDLTLFIVEFDIPRPLAVF